MTENEKNFDEVENTAQVEAVDAEVDAQELEEMDAPDWSTAVSAAVSAGAVTVGVAIT